MSIKREMDLRDYIRENRREVPVSDLAKQVKTGFTFEDDKLKAIREKITTGCKELSSMAKIMQGLNTGCNKVFIIDEKEYNGIKQDTGIEEVVKPLIKGKFIERYKLNNSKLYLVVIPSGWTNKHKGEMKPEEYITKRFPKLIELLRNKGESFGIGKKNVTDVFTRDSMGDYWWELRNFADYSIFNRGIRQSRIARDLKCMYTPGYCTTCTHIIDAKHEDRWITCILNSKIYENIHRNFLSIGIIGGIDFSVKESIERALMPKCDCSILNKYVDDIQKLKSENKDTSQLEAEVEKIVQELYGLTDEEVGYLCK